MLSKEIKNVIDVLRERYVNNLTPPSLTIYKQPAYRGCEDNKCSIGCLIDDSTYKRKFEECDVLTLLDRYPYIVSSLQSRGLYPLEICSRFNEFLYDVQLWHDLWYVAHYLKVSKEEVATSLNKLQSKWEVLCRNPID